MVDLGKVTKLSLYLDASIALTSLNSCCIIDLLKQTPNIQSLAVRARSIIERHSSSVEEICSTGRGADLQMEAENSSLRIVSGGPSEGDLVANDGAEQG